MTLTADAVHAVLIDCLYKSDEVQDGKAPSDALIVPCIVHTFGLNPERVAKHEQEIAGFLAELPDEFKQGWSFLNMCNDKHGRQWADMHRTMEELVALGLATRRLQCCAPREFWPALPGGVPYYQIVEPPIPITEEKPA